VGAPVRPLAVRGCVVTTVARLPVATNSAVVGLLSILTQPPLIGNWPVFWVILSDAILSKLSFELCR
jgi:hypothetical protein